MTYKFLLKIFLTSLGSLAILAPIAIAQERPECYIIDNTGELTDLTDICNVSQRRSPQTAPATNEAPNNINNNTNVIDFSPSNAGSELDDNVYVLGENVISNRSGAFNSSYYIDNEIGSDYTAYIRKYRTSPTSLTRQTLREQVFQFDRHSQSLTSIIRRGHDLPFIIYRYPI